MLKLYPKWGSSCCRSCINKIFNHSLGCCRKFVYFIVFQHISNIELLFSYKKVLKHFYEYAILKTYSYLK